jgi:glycosyltransferase involved in cell wall biosynthesis
MHVSLDVTAVPRQPAGAGRYTVELAAALARRDDVALTLLTRRDDVERWRPETIEGATARTTARAVAPSARPLRLLWEQGRLPRLLDRLAPALHHSPHYTMPERARVPVVVTIHDVTFFDHPEWHERSKVWVFRRAITKAAAQADALVCVSQTTAERLAQVCTVRVPLFVAPHGVDHARLGPAERAPGADRTVLGRLGLEADRPFVVFIGTLEPRKGVAGLVRAFDQVAATRPDALLVLAGQSGWGSDDVARAIAQSREPERVRCLGYVPDDAVPALLRTAAAAVYP